MNAGGKANNQPEGAAREVEREREKRKSSVPRTEEESEVRRFASSATRFCCFRTEAAFLPRLTSKEFSSETIKYNFLSSRRTANRPGIFSSSLRSASVRRDVSIALPLTSSSLMTLYSRLNIRESSDLTALFPKIGISFRPSPRFGISMTCPYLSRK